MSPHELSILKALVPFLHPGLRPAILLCCSMEEMKCQLHAMRNCPPPPKKVEDCIMNKDCLLEAIVPVCNDKEKAMLDQFTQLEATMQFLKLYNELAPETDSCDNCDSKESKKGTSQEELLSRFLTPEQKELIALLQN